MNSAPRSYQQEADQAIYDGLLENDKCIVKMFCGTGKSRIMRCCRSAQGVNLCVYVMPSLSLIEQFYTDYLHDFDKTHILRISCEQGSTTDPTEIEHFLKKDKNKIICVTYQSFKTLIDNLAGNKINVCIFDEAHHILGEKMQQTQQTIFETSACEKQIFFTATPKNSDSVVMDDKDGSLIGSCGKLVYKYSYFKGVMNGFLNPFEIRLDFYTENTNKSVYESIARAVLATGNSRVLTFHVGVNGDSVTSVLQFVDEALFIAAFNKVLHEEFPDKVRHYQSVRMVGLTSKIIPKTRTDILRQFDTTPDNEIMIISSCQTIGEGIDTKRANMCVFVDPKSSFVSITQNIGRIVRKVHGSNRPNSTILIPCWVDKEKYLECGGDKDKCDEVIREDINASGNFNSILNVMSALKQEDEDLFDACLNYPSAYSPQEIEGNLAKHGYQLEEPVGDETLVESLEHVLDAEVDCDEDWEETDEAMLLRVAEENNVAIEVHSNSLETPIEYYGIGNDDEGNNREVVRIFKTYDEVKEENVYKPIVKKDGTKRNADRIEPLRRENRFNVNVHTNPDVKVLWNLSNDFDLSRDICSCIIDCEVVDMWPQRFEELKTFIDENGRTPSHGSRNPGEKSLGYWLSNQKRKYRPKIEGMKNVERYNLWAQFLEEYKEYFISNYQKWINNFDNIKCFINKNKKLPSQHSTIIDEKFLGGWLATQTKNYKKKLNSMKDEEPYNLWSKFLEDYKEYFILDHEKWFNNFDKLKMFIMKNKKKPICKSKNVDEKFIGGWLSDQQKHYKKNTSGMKDQTRYNLWTKFLEDYAEYFISIDAIWMCNFEELKTFIKLNNKKPSTSSNSQNEKSIGGWLSNQQRQYKNNTKNMKDNAKCNLWSQFLEEFKDYFVSTDNVWFQQFEELKTFISINKKKPSQKKDKIANWVSTQMQNYKNKKEGMKDDTRYNLWTQFLEDYKEYFDGAPSAEEDPSTIEDHAEEAKKEEYPIKIKVKKSAKLQYKTAVKKVETADDIRVRTTPLITQFHNKFCKMRSDNLAQHFQQNPADFHEYHRVRDECFKTYDDVDIPCYRVIMELAEIKKTKKGGKHVVDMGCGTASISAHFKGDPRFHFTNYDHVAINDTVQVCDISHMPLEDNSVDICIMSLALWGSNCEEYIAESYRVLENSGKLYIIDTTKRWSTKDDIGNIIVGEEGAKLIKIIVNAGFKIESQRIDKFCLFVCKI
jgi:superfamily II DNA or RNA helicase